MNSPSNELQALIFTTLSGDGALGSLINGRVYDRVPENAVFPFISFGPFDETSEDADCIDGFSIALQLDVWSRDVGFPECRTISNAVRLALDLEDVELHSNALVSFRHRQTRFFRDPDGLTSHGVLSFEAFVEQP